MSETEVRAYTERDIKVYWSSGFVNGVIMATYFAFAYKAIRNALDERKYKSNVKSKGTPFGPVEQSGRVECHNEWEPMRHFSR